MSFPGPVRFTRPSKVAKFFEAFTEHTVLEAHEPLHFVACDDRVVVLGRERIRVKSTGRTWACEWVNAVIVRDEKIAGFREYTDTAAIASAFGNR